MSERHVRPSVVRLSGGLGNQLFQYLFGCSLRLTTGVPVWFDATDAVDENSVRPFQLQELGLAGPFVSATQIRLADDRVLLRRIKDLSQSTEPPARLELTLIRERGPGHDPALPYVESAFYDGYWQSYRYWTSFPTLRALMHTAILSVKLSATAEQLQSEIRKQPCIGVHVRRGDYTTAAASDYHGICSLDYYRRGIALCAPQLEAQKIFVFSDDPNTAEELVGEFPGRAVLASGISESGVEDFVLLSRCTHHVIANSSFSYLAAFFREPEEGVTVMPYPWFSHRDDDGTRAPSTWVRLNRRSGNSEPEDDRLIREAEVTVIIPTVNRAEMLREAVRTAFNQTLSPVEVILSLNGASDEVEAVALELGGSDHRIRVVRDPIRSLPRARNNGLSISKGKWVAFLDDDDLWAPEKLSRQIETIVRRAADVVACNYLVFDEDGVHDISNLPAQTFSAWRNDLIIHNCFAGGSAALGLRRVFQVAGGFDESLRSCEDHDMWRRLAQAGFLLTFMDEKLVFCRRSSNSMTRDNPLMLSGELAHLSKMVATATLDQNFLRRSFANTLRRLVLHLGKTGEVEQTDDTAWLGMLAREHAGDVQAIVLKLTEKTAEAAELRERLTAVMRASSFVGVGSTHLLEDLERFKGLALKLEKELGRSRSAERESAAAAQALAAVASVLCSALDHADRSLSLEQKSASN